MGRIGADFHCELLCTLSLVSVIGFINFFGSSFAFCTWENFLHLTSDVHLREHFVLLWPIDLYLNLYLEFMSVYYDYNHFINLQKDSTLDAAEEIIKAWIR